MKKLFIIIIILSIYTLCFPDNLTLKYLVDTKWGPENNISGYYIKFKNDSTFEISTMGQCVDLPYYGNFEIDKKDLILKLMKYGNDNLDSAKEIILEFTISNESIYRYLYLKYLKGNLVNINNDEIKFSFWDLNSSIPDGSKRYIETKKYGKIPIYILNLKKEVVENPEIYTYPSTDSSIYVFYHDLYDKNKIIKKSYNGIIGRSESKDVVNNILDYWYLLDFNIDLMNGGYKIKNKDGELIEDYSDFSGFWIHGSFLK